ncbi:hypothetical protein [Acutalibacter sp. 1XD8-36]|uniref:hypothetical protein n=1 Tax=Acutalibacter sp. 1XD8-36 TaxID=2320852 RepID=UPI00262C512A|nr:hypothetical protein [Acutalibacter sp. 1XD8-36]
MTTIGVFSSVHGGQILEYCKWDDQKAIAAFDRFGPDIVCGEVRRSDMESSEKHYPTEYDRYIFDYCKNRNIPFVPCDYWTEEEVRHSVGGTIQFSGFQRFGPAQARYTGPAQPGDTLHHLDQAQPPYCGEHSGSRGKEPG